MQIRIDYDAVPKVFCSQASTNPSAEETEMTIQFNTAHCKRKPAVHNIYSLDSIKNIYIYVVLNADLNGVPKNVTGALVPFSTPGGDNLWRLSTCNTIKKSYFQEQNVFRIKVATSTMAAAIYTTNTGQRHP